MKEKSQYKNLGEWRKACPSEYSSAKSQGFMDIVCENFGWDKPKKRVGDVRPAGYWNDKEICHKEALKYKVRSHFQKHSSRAYEVARVNGWLDEICSHMKSVEKFKNSKPRNYWTKEKCYEESLKYEYKSDFRKCSRRAYERAQQKGWLDEICSHFKIEGPTKQECIEESNKHETATSWKTESKETYGQAKRMEWYDECVEHMEHMKNRVPNGHWNKQTIIKSIGNSTTTKGWMGSVKGGADAARRFNIYDECRKIIKNNKLKEKFNEEEIKILEKFNKEEVKRFEKDNRKEKRIKERRENHIKEISKNIEKYNIDSINRWRRFDEQSYGRAKYHNLLDFFCEKYGFEKTYYKLPDKKPKGFWTKEKCLKESSKHKSQLEWKRVCHLSHKAAYRMGWMEECCKYMK